MLASEEMVFGEEAPQEAPIFDDPMKLATRPHTGDSQTGQASGLQHKCRQPKMRRAPRVSVIDPVSLWDTPIPETWVARTQVHFAVIPREELRGR